jgi:phosphoribosylanthranilate isomerase
MTRVEDIVAVNEARPDFIGFVVDVPGSRRSVSCHEFEQLSALVEPGIGRVGVFVDEPVEVIARLYEARVLDYAQLHGHEDEECIMRLRQLCPVAIMKAFVVRSAEDVERAQRSTANLVLLDNGRGTGQAFDWTLVRQLRRPFFLAGGLGPHNVAQAIADVRPWGVDMSTGLETDGRKDADKIRAAVAAVRREG